MSLVLSSGVADYRYDDEISLADLAAVVEDMMVTRGVPRNAIVTDIHYFSHQYYDGEKSFKSRSVRVNYSVDNS